MMEAVPDSTLLAPGRIERNYPEAKELVIRQREKGEGGSERETEEVLRILRERNSGSVEHN